MTLAIALGKTLDEIGAMSSAEYAAWKRYYSDAPFEPWLQTALICSTIANFAGKQLKDNARATPAHFLPRREDEEEEEEDDPLAHFREQAALFDRK